MRSTLSASLLLVAGSSFAAEPYEGKWGTDVQSCRAEPIFTLTSRTIGSPTFGCRQVTYTRSGEKWSAKARQCYAEGEENATSMTFDVLMKEGRMQIDWGKEGKSALLVRCAR